MPQKREDLIVVHIDCQVLYSYSFTSVKLLSESNYFNSLILLLELFEVLINFLKTIFVSRISVFFPFSFFFFIKSVGTSFINTTEKWMLFSSPFIGNNLIQIPCQNQVHNCIYDKTDQRIPDCVIVKRIWEIRSQLNWLGINYSLKSQYKSCVWYDTQSTINSDRRIIGVSRNKR